MATLRIVHLSDVHLWKYDFHPGRLSSKRMVGMAALLLGRARRFQLERLPEVVRRVESLAPDHVVISGDLTTTSLPDEFRMALDGLADLLRDPRKATVVPGNHDRYTRRSVWDRMFDRSFAPYVGAPEFPWVRMIADRTAILGLDPTRPGLLARGLLPPAQLAAAQALWEQHRGAVDRWIVACHYPLDAPPGLKDDLFWKRLYNAADLTAWLATIGPHLYCCGHVHHAWAMVPDAAPNQLALNAGAPLLRDRTGQNPPGFLEILLDGPDVNVVHHAWDGEGWIERPLVARPDFFPSQPLAPV